MGSFFYFKITKQRRKLGKVDALLNKKLENVKWGEFRLRDLFEIKNTLSFNKEALTSGYEYDYVTRTSQNQGILQETGFVNEENINSGGNWSLGLLQMDFFYRHKPWYAGQFVRKIIPKIKLTQNSILYFTVVLNTLKQKLLSVLVRDVDNVFLNMKIQLPTKNEKIDFEFMESFIAELEAQRIAELETYLLATGIKDYTLTNEEELALQDFETMEFKEFKIEDLFEKVKVKSLKYKTSDLPSESKDEFVLPALTAGIQNQGLNNYVPKDNATILKNVISISANGANTGATFYQNKEFTVLQDAYAVIWNYTDELPTDNQYLYLTTAISKTLFGNYEWTNKAGWERIKFDKILLPINNGKIDYKFMATLISAIQKLVIKDVVLYADRKIEATKSVVNG